MLFRGIMALVSSLEVGTRLKAKLDAIKRQSIVAAIAAVLLLMAAAFGLVTAYFALIQYFNLLPLESAGIIAAALAVLGVLLLACLPLFGEKKPKPKPAAMIDAGTEGLMMADRSLQNAMRQVSPVTVLAVAFIAGVLASRR